MALADMENVPAVPGNVFQGPHNNVYHNFCDKWSPGTELSMTVDTSGNRKNPAELFSRRDVELNLDDYMHYNIDLSFTPSSGMNECVKDCVDAFSQMANDCRSMESEQLYPCL
ncbi:hypothetical protein RRF57_001577 [Xylaria bambusicola]|uniref:Uncharacterized protein n=1 Tax=Xylaria bambusicola TaxID=326684 RepID=A0AAN7UHG3_9PEZI